MSGKIKINKLAAKRKARVRGKMFGTAVRPRLTVFRSNKFTYLQVINDETGKVLAVANDKMLAGKGGKISGTKSERAVKVAKDIAKQLKENKVQKLQFDRGSYRYHGRVKIVAETVRSAGIEV
jgi:large subunit ribosomal protein L18